MRQMLFLLFILCCPHVAAAKTNWSDPLAKMTVTCAFHDEYYYTVSCNKSSPPEGDRNKWKQHLGTDFRAGVNDPVKSPVDGKILVDEFCYRKECRAQYNGYRGIDGANAFIIIRDSQSGDEHVLGHVYSRKTLAEIKANPYVKRGEIVAYIAGQAIVHFHWGLNVASVGNALLYKTQCLINKRWQDCQWGFGAAPFEATDREIRGMGWRPVL